MRFDAKKYIYTGIIQLLLPRPKYGLFFMPSWNRSKVISKFAIKVFPVPIWKVFINLITPQRPSGPNDNSHRETDF